MQTPTTYFPNVTLLVTHYNRSNSLERLLHSFERMGCSFGDVVVSDDGSQPEHIAAVRSLSQKMGFRLITTPKNRGLGNNINKGQDAVVTAYTLYVQEDFEPAMDFPAHFSDALSILEERKEIDIARFYAYFKYPYLKPLSEGFSEMRFSIWKPGYLKFYAYSDHPHLRRSNFFDRFGRYTEGVKGDITEYRMMMSFLQHQGKGIFYEEFRSLFEQKNSNDEPSTMTSSRNYWREADNGIVWLMREIYRHLKFNLDYLFRRF